MVDTSFMDDVIFPEAVSWGTTGGPDWPAEIVSLGSGNEERNTPWSAPLRSYDAKYGVRTRAELYEVIELYLVAMGRVRGFRFKDWSDYRSSAPHLAPTELDQALGTGDGATLTFDLYKRYTRASQSFSRRIRKPYGSVLVAVDGVPAAAGFTADLNAGSVTFDSAPALGAALTWGGEFHVPARFDCKLDQITLRGPISDIPSIMLKELRNP